MTVEDKKSTNSLFRDVVRKMLKNKIAVISFVVIILYFIIAALAKLGIVATSFDSVYNDLAYEAPSWFHWFGRDLFGRDVLARAIHGSYTALSIGFIAASIAVPIGVTLGSLSGYFGGIVDDLIVWFYTTVDSIPYILLLIALSFVLGQGTENMYVAIGITSWVTLCRLIRGEFMKHKNREYVVAAEALGASHRRRMFVHILPNVFHIILIQYSLQFVYAIKMEVILSYLGLGVEPGTPSWGLMIDDAKQDLARGIWWGMAAATLLMFGLVLSFNLFNDALRGAIDPRLKGRT